MCLSRPAVVLERSEAGISDADVVVVHPVNESPVSTGADQVIGACGLKSAAVDIIGGRRRADTFVIKRHYYVFQRDAADAAIIETAPITDAVVVQVGAVVGHSDIGEDRRAPDTKNSSAVFRAIPADGAVSDGQSPIAAAVNNVNDAAATTTGRRIAADRAPDDCQGCRPAIIGEVAYAAAVDSGVVADRAFDQGKAGIAAVCRVIEDTTAITAAADAIAGDDAVRDRRRAEVVDSAAETADVIAVGDGHARDRHDGPGINYKDGQVGRSISALNRQNIRTETVDCNVALNGKVTVLDDRINSRARVIARIACRYVEINRVRARNSLRYRDCFTQRAVGVAHAVISIGGLRHDPWRRLTLARAARVVDR